jgi:hypothetical protein
VPSSLAGQRRVQANHQNREVIHAVSAAVAEAILLPRANDPARPVTILPGFLPAQETGVALQPHLARMPRIVTG